MEEPHVLLDPLHRDVGLECSLARLPQQKFGLVNARDLEPTLRELQRVASGAAAEIKQAASIALSQREDLADLLVRGGEPLR